MHIGSGEHIYEWIEDWVVIPDSPSARDNGRTHAVAVTRNGRILVFHQAENALLTYSPEGVLLSAVGGDRWLGAHGMTLIEENGVEYLWLADQNTCEVAKATLDGQVVQTLPPPPEELRPEGKYTPTWAAANPVNGDVWVADGYGSHNVYRYDRRGNYLAILTGEEGAGRFREPHGIAFSPTGELWITDRCNHRLCVYDAEGNFLRDRAGACHSPCCFAFLEDRVYIPELFTGVKILDPAFNVLASLGVSDVISPRADGGWWPPNAPQGWPNLIGTDYIQPGQFNAPHGLTVAPNGDIYVVEWIVGGRITKLAKR